MSETAVSQRADGRQTRPGRWRRPAILLLAIIVLGTAAAWRYGLIRFAPAAPVLYGNVDIREVDLAFDAEGRVARMLVQEGDTVAPGQVLAVLDDGTYRAAHDLASGRVDAQKAVLAELLAGSRPEEIARDQATVDAYQAILTNARAELARQRALLGRGFAAQQQFDQAQAAMLQADGQLRAAGETLRLAQLGPRQEDIDAARATLASDQAMLRLAETQLARTVLKAPEAGTILSRNLEPGAIVLPTTSAYTLALTNDVWIRTYLPEPLLGRVRAGQVLEITTDSAPGHPYKAAVGFVSPTAEFTPKAVETPELRTQLVYRARLHVLDADAGLRQGMPVTVHLPAAP